MAKLALIGAIFLGLCGTASARVLTAAQEHAPDPPAKWQTMAFNAALTYWADHGHVAPWDPTCQMTVTYAPLNDDGALAGETLNDCNIIINSDNGWLLPDTLCLDLTHEVGHVMLGPDAFPNNLSDPSHSSDPDNIMYPVIFDAKTSECTAMLNTIFAPLRPHKHHARGFKGLRSAGTAIRQG